MKQDKLVRLLFEFVKNLNRSNGGLTKITGD
jgi:hypothetical protein